MAEIAPAKRPSSASENRMVPPCLSGREAEVLEELRFWVGLHERMPTMKDLCADLKIARGSLMRILNRLTRKGYLHQLPRGSLNYQLAEAG